MTTFKVLSYNVLADCLAKIKKDDNLYMKFNVRFAKIKAEILKADADIVALQECDHFDEQYIPMLKHAGYYPFNCERKHTSLDDAMRSSLVIGYKRQVFEYVDQEVLDFDM